MIPSICFQPVGTPPGSLKQNLFCLLNKQLPIFERITLINKMSPPRIYLKEQAAAEPPHFSCSQFTEKMFFRGRTWLWLYITTGFVLGSELHGLEQRGGNNCYQLNRFLCSFEGAERHCHAGGGHLAFTWNQEVQDLLWDFLKKEKWWVGGNLTLPKKHQGKNHPGEAQRFSGHEGNFITFPLR